MIKCKITVLKTSFNEDLVDQYVEEERKKTLGTCEVFKEGEEFIVDPICNMPENFCSWAWNDIYKSLIGLASGGDWGMWYQNKNNIIACCTDGTRPVYFKIEKCNK